MRRKTAYGLAIEALIEKRRRHYAFDHNMHLMFAKAGYLNKATLSAHKNYVRISKTIKILEAERDHKQLNLFKTAEVTK